MSTIIDGTTGITTDGLIVGVEKAQLIKLETAQATTSGTSINFTGIPTWAKKITVMFNGVSTTGTSGILVQIGSGSITTSGYTSTSNETSTGGISNLSSTSGFVVKSTSASNTLSGSIILTLINTNIWVSTHVSKISTGNVIIGSGDCTALGGFLDRVRIATLNGTDTFDAGSVNILIEGSL
ncbi:MAG: hypothetical protein ACK40T_11705 [Akkermansiaceae bacterium]|jgi:hypothetical protein